MNKSQIAHSQLQIAKAVMPLKNCIVFMHFLVKEAYFRNRYDDLFLVLGHFLLFCHGWIISLLFSVGFN